jgi:pimeloyl-ACP methyl ester carboxylesterase
MRHDYFSARLAAFLCLIVISAPSGHAQAELSSAAAFHACPVAELDRVARCGTVEVLEDVRHPKGKRIALNVMVLPASGSHPALTDPIVFLSGGPGQAATDSVADIGGSLAELNRERDVVFIDQRGTGKSEPLHCALFSSQDPAASLRDIYPPAAVQRCAKELQGKAEVANFSFTHFADDLETVRKALGYGPVNLYALSFGTRAAQIYMRAYPRSVRTAYLGSIVPIDITTPLPFARAAQAVLDHTFAACTADPACHKAFPALHDEFDAVLQRLDGGVQVKLPGSSEMAVLGRGRAAEHLRSMLYKPEGAAAVPSLIHHAYLGDWSPWVEGVLANTRDVDQYASTGLFFTLTCNEDVAFIKDEDIPAQTRNTFIGDFRVRNQQAACALWPKYGVSRKHRAALHTDVPTLIVSGDLDPATPIEFATHAAPGFSHRAEIVLHGQGHTGWGACADQAYSRLVRKGSVLRIRTDCATTPRPDFKID